MNFLVVVVVEFLQIRFRAKANSVIVGETHWGAHYIGNQLHDTLGQPLGSMKVGHSWRKAATAHRGVRPKAVPLFTASADV